MKIFILFAFMPLALHSYSQDYYDDMGILSYYQEFKEGSTQRLYGDNVVLRKKPSKDGKAIDTLSIGSEVIILQKSQERITVNGKESKWYKVKSNKGTGYIAGRLIALDALEHNNGLYLVITAGPEDDQKFRIRYLKNGDYYGKEGALYTSAFQINVYDNKGLEAIEGIVTIDLFAEACGVDGGVTYIFNDGEKLHNAIHCSSVADGGVFWFDEELEFPEERGWGDHITYEREFGESVNEELNITRAVKHSVTLEWTAEGFSPNVSELDFDEE
ncbi:MAG: hypothetical protein Crog4KO_19330 [Crocinitomicaceae bacterium]